MKFHRLIYLLFKLVDMRGGGGGYIIRYGANKARTLDGGILSFVVPSFAKMSALPFCVIP